MLANTLPLSKGVGFVCFLLADSRGAAPPKFQPRTGLQRQTTWSGSSLSENLQPASLVKSGSLTFPQQETPTGTTPGEPGLRGRGSRYPRGEEIEMKRPYFKMYLSFPTHSGKSAGQSQVRKQQRAVDPPSLAAWRTGRARELGGQQPFGHQQFLDGRERPADSEQRRGRTARGNRSGAGPGG